MTNQSFTSITNQSLTIYTKFKPWLPLKKYEKFTLKMKYTIYTIINQMLIVISAATINSIDDLIRESLITYLNAFQYNNITQEMIMELANCDMNQAVQYFEAIPLLLKPELYIVQDAICILIIGQYNLMKAGKVFNLRDGGVEKGIEYVEIIDPAHAYAYSETVSDNGRRERNTVCSHFVRGLDDCIIEMHKNFFKALCDERYAFKIIRIVEGLIDMKDHTRGVTSFKAHLYSYNWGDVGDGIEIRKLCIIIKLFIQLTGHVIFSEMGHNFRDGY